MTIDIIVNDAEAIIEIEYPGLEIPEKLMGRLITLKQTQASRLKKAEARNVVYKNGLDKINGNMKVETLPFNGTVITLRIPNYYKVPV